MKVRNFGKFALLVAMITISVFLLADVSLAQVLLIAPAHINLGSAKPGDEIELKKEIVVKFSKDVDVDVEKINVAPCEEEDFSLRLKGKDEEEIPAWYKCKKIAWSKKARMIRIKITVKVDRIKWEYRAGKYIGEIIITLSESS